MVQSSILIFLSPRRRQAEVDAEADKWMGMISTEGEGLQAEAEVEGQVG